MGFVTADQLALCQLIRHELWNEPIDIERFDAMGFSWHNVLDLAEKHSLLGLLADSILSLHESSGPSDKSKLMLLSYHRQCIQQNQKVNAQLIKVLDKLAASDIHPLLLKGQGVACCYPHPLIRTSGDIDLYPQHSQLAEAVKCLSEFGSCEDDLKELGPTHKHASIDINGIDVELHDHLEHSQFGAQSDIALQRLIDYWMEPSRAVAVQIDGREVLVPHPQFHLLYLFVHYFNHLYFFGIGLRQVCDWMTALHYYNGQYDKAQLEHDLRAIGYYHPWQHMATIAIQYLGANPETMPFALKGESRVGEELLQKIFAGGNFGVFLPEETPSHFRRTISFYRKWIRYSIIVRGGKFSDNLIVLSRIFRHIITRQKHKLM